MVVNNTVSESSDCGMFIQNFPKLKCDIAGTYVLSIL